MFWTLIVSILVLLSYVEANSPLQLVVLKDLSKTEQAMCLDGSPPAYYLLKGRDDGVNKWIIFHEGGGWCESLDDCFNRSKMHLGSTKGYSPTMGNPSGFFDDSPKLNPLTHNWNKVWIKYCDGTSLSSNLNKPIQHKGQLLHFKGFNIAKAIRKSLFQDYKLGEATEVIISGSSAGGLSTYLHVDQYCDALPNVKRCVGVPDAGFFLDHQEVACQPKEYLRYVKHEDSDNMLGTTIPGNYHCGIHWIAKTTNVTFHEDCYKDYTLRNPAKVSNCMFAQHVTPFIKYPIFVLNSIYDAWQVHYVLKDESPENVNRLGKNVTHLVQQQVLSRNPNHGAYLTSCNLHVVVPNLKAKTDGAFVMDAVTEWYNGLDKSGGKKLWLGGEAYPCKDCCAAMEWEGGRTPIE